MSDVKGCEATSTSTTTTTGDATSSSKLDSKRSKRGFLRGVLDGWRSSVHSRDSQESPSHSTSCGQLTASSSKDTDSLPEVVQDDSRVRLDLRSDSDEKMRTTPSPALGLLGVPSLGSEVTSSSSPSLVTSLASSSTTAAPPVKPGFLYQPTAIAFDAVQRVFAIGNRSGYLRIFGLPPTLTSQINSDIDCHARHPSLPSAVIQLSFVINEGLLVSLCADDHVHLWNWKLKVPEIIHSLKFQRERLTVFHLPFQSKWMFVGTEKGNVHVANTDSFQLSGYVINWNKAIDLSQRSHPGAVVHLSDCPIDPNKLLIGFETGLITFWDLRNRSADTRVMYHEALTSISWHHEGRQFMASHPDGSFTTWDLKQSSKPISILYPHARTITDDLKIEPCRPITKIDLRTCKTDEPFTILTGGLPYGASLDYATSLGSNPPSPTNPTVPGHHAFPSAVVHPASASASIHSSNEALHTIPAKVSSSTPPVVSTPTTVHSSSQGLATPSAAAQNSSSSSSNVKTNHHDFTLGPKSLTIIHGKTTTLLEMKHNIVDFVTLCETPYDCDFNEPFAVLVLLSKDLMMIDLQG